MKRSELTDKQKLAFLERLVVRMFGWYNICKIDWEQDWTGAMRKITFRNVNFDRDLFNVLNRVISYYQLDIDARADIGKESFLAPTGADEKWKHISTSIDLELMEEDWDFYLRKSKKELKDVRKRENPRWTEEDAQREDHHYVTENLEGKRTRSYRLLTKKERIKSFEESITDLQNKIKEMREAE